MDKLMVGIPNCIHEYLSTSEGIMVLHKVLVDAFCSYYDAWAQMSEPEFDMSEVTELQRFIRDTIFNTIYLVPENANEFDASDLCDYLLHFDDVALSGRIELVMQVFDAYLAQEIALDADHISNVCTLRRGIIRIIHDAAANVTK